MILYSRQVWIRFDIFIGLQIAELIRGRILIIGLLFSQVVNDIFGVIRLDQLFGFLLYICSFLFGNYCFYLSCIILLIILLFLLSHFLFIFSSEQFILFSDFLIHFLLLQLLLLNLLFLQLNSLLSLPLQFLIIFLLFIFSSLLLHFDIFDEAKLFFRSIIIDPTLIP